MDRDHPDDEAVDAFNRGLPVSDEVDETEVDLRIYRDGDAPEGKLVIVLEDSSSRRVKDIKFSRFRRILSDVRKARKTREARKT